MEEAVVDAAQVNETSELEAALRRVEVVVSAGGPGVCLLPRESRIRASDLRVAVDLNAVPPEGIEGIQGPDAGIERDGCVAYGAIGVGGIKMKIHKACIATLLESGEHILDAETIFEVGQRI